MDVQRSDGEDGMSVRDVLHRFSIATDAASAIEGAIVALGAFQKEELITGLIDAVHDEKLPIQSLAIRVMRELDLVHECGPDTFSNSRLISKVVEMVDSENQTVRRLAVNLLGDFGKAARSSLPTLERFLTCKDEDEQFIAATSILQIDSRHHKALWVLLSHLRNEDSEYRCRAVWNLGSLGCVDAVSDLELLTDDPDLVVRGEVSLALWRITGDANIARVVGRRMMTDSDWIVRQMGREHLQELNEELVREDPAAKTEMILRVYSIGEPPAVRYLILNERERTWWDGQSFQQDAARAVLYATADAACEDMHLT